MTTAGKDEQTLHDETTLDISIIMSQTASEAALSDRGSNCAGMDFWALDSALTAEHASQLNKGASSPHGESVGVPCESIHLQPVLVISAMEVFSPLGGDRSLASEGPPLKSAARLIHRILHSTSPRCQCRRARRRESTCKPVDVLAPSASIHAVTVGRQICNCSTKCGYSSAALSTTETV